MTSGSVTQLERCCDSEDIRAPDEDERPPKSAGSRIGKESGLPAFPAPEHYAG